MDEIFRLFESSSSESEDEYFFMFNFSNKKRKSQHRVKGFLAEVVDLYSDEEFRRNFRLTRQTANYLIERYEKSRFFRQNFKQGRKTTDARKQMLAFLWFAANKNTYREVGNLFDMSASTFFKHLSCMLDFFHNIAKDCIHFPESDDGKQQVAAKFESISNFNDVIGCIDGSYLYIRKPVHKIRSTYTNRHDLLSITLQAVCDADKKFLDVFIGSSSKIHDARIFGLSSISTKLPHMCGQRYHLLGDSAYPVREYLLTPYKDYGHITARQKRYNLRHAQTRVKIENAFGLLKQRFRQLIRMDFFTVLKMSKFAMACCVLHNVCLERGDRFEDEEEYDGDDEDDDEINGEQTHRNEAVSGSDSRRNNALRRLGELKRDSLANSFI